MIKKIINCLFVLGVLSSFLSCTKAPVVSSISLNTSTLGLLVGEQYQFSVTYDSPEAPKPKYKWEVSNSSVANISGDGMLTAVSKGQVTVTVSAQSGGEGTLSSTCFVTIDDVQAESISLNKTELIIKNKETEYLTYTILPEAASYREVEWKSSNEDVARIYANGRLDAINKGEAIITATIKNTSISATCKVTVEPIIASSVKIAHANPSMLLNETQKLSYELLPDHCEPINLNWSSSDESILTVDNDGLCTAIAEGTVIVSLSSDDYLISDSVEIQVIDPYMKVGQEYISKWGLACTVKSIKVYTNGAKMTCSISYTIKNVTPDKVLAECTFACRQASGSSAGQYGFFDSLYPEEAVSRSYTFDTLSSDPFVELVFVNTFQNETVYPDAPDLVWDLTRYQN